MSDYPTYPEQREKPQPDVVVIPKTVLIELLKANAGQKRVLEAILKNSS